MNKKIKGFSLAELLISLLIISIVLSAAIPTITKKSGATRENIWNWSDHNNSIYAASGTNQSAILGTNRVPSIKWSDILNPEQTYSPDPDDNGGWAMRIAERITYSDDGNKMVILKRLAYPGESDFVNSHIAFYNTLSDTTNGLAYSGRLTMDPGNIALGKGALQNQRPVLSTDSAKIVGENTAIGHFALLSNRVGVRNTALGKKTLSNNTTGSYNTAVGFGALFSYETDKGDVTNDTAADFGSKNTAVGALSQRMNISGQGNTSIGVSSLVKNETGHNNTAIGNNALGKITSGSGNTAIGNSACSLLTSGSSNICIGYGAGDELGDDDSLSDNYRLFIGSVRKTDSTADDINEPSIITGRTYKDADDHDKELFINAKRFGLRPFNGSGNVFEFLSFAGGGNGYNTSTSGANAGRFGIAHFNLRDTGTNTTTGNEVSNSLTFTAPYPNKVAYILSHDKYNSIDPSGMNFNTQTKMNFNNALTFDFSEITSSLHSVNLKAETPKTDGSTTPDGQKYSIVLNDTVEIRPRMQSGMSGGIPISIAQDSLQAKAGNFELHSSSDAMIFGLDDGDSYQLWFSNKADPTSGNEEGFFLNSPKKVDMYTSVFRVEGSNSLSYISLGDKGASKNIYISPSKIDLNDNASSINLWKSTSDIYINGIYGNKKVKEALNDLDTRLTPSSDIRLKNVSGDNKAGLKEINALEVKNFTYKNDKEKTPHVGVIAQQLQKIFPNAVSKDDKGYLRIRTEDIFYAMVNSIKDLCKQIQDLTAKVTGLDKRITELEKQNKALEKRLEKLEKEQAKK